MDNAQKSNPQVSFRRESNDKWGELQGPLLQD
jgi:hypothetical protein